MRIVFLLLLLGGSIGLRGQAQETGWKDLPVNEFRQLLADTTVQLVDVRTAGEFKEGHIPGAKNMDVRSAAFDSLVGRLDVRRPVAVYCRSGVRSRMAARKLKERGFKVYNLDRGYLSWEKASNPTE